VAGVDIAAFVVSVVSAIGTAFGILYTRRSASSDRISAIADQSALKVAKEQLAIEQGPALQGDGGARGAGAGRPRGGVAR